MTDPDEVARIARGRGPDPRRALDGASMNWLCRILGHRLPKTGWWGDGLYGKVEGPLTDGTGRTHYRLTQECPRCGENWTVGRFHGSQVRPKQGIHRDD